MDEGRVNPMTSDTDFSTWLRLADHVLEAATKDQLAETARLLALNLAHYQLKYGDLPLENVEELLRTEEIDEETARLISTGMENLVGLLGLLVTQDQGANEIVQ